MQMIKFTHACVRLTDGGSALLIDPGIWAEAEAYQGASAVLITHEHFDHVDADRVAASGLPVYAPAPVAAELAEKGATVTAVEPGQSFAVEGFTVDVVGGRHALIYENLPDCVNVGYTATAGGTTVYHPGDSLFVPETRIDVLLTPVSGPWFKLGEGLDFVRAIAPEKAYPIHDRLLTEDIGMPLVDGWFERMGRTSYARPAVGDVVAL
jgi:L-ascorbate metabolism protein UlaG (beta-lactamase superfamily)